MRMKKTAFKTLTSKLLSIYVPLLALAAVVLFLILEVLFYQKERDQLAASLNNIVTIQSAAFQTAVWEYDVDQVQFLLREFLLFPNFQGAAIYDTSDELIAQVGDMKTEPEIPEFRAEQTLFFSPRSDTEPIGRLVMTVHSKEIWLNVFEHIKTNAIILLVLLASLIASTLFAVNRVISLPLQHLRQAIEQTKNGSTRNPVMWESDDELGQVVRAYNEMQEKEAVAELEVKKHRENLESLVHERTKEVEHKSSLLEAVLGSINQGLVAYDEELMLIISNERFREIREIPKELAQPGASFVDWIRFDAERGEFPGDDLEEIIHDQVERAERFISHNFERTRPNGSIVEITGGPLPNGGFVSTFSDITERKKAEQKLADAYNIISSSIDYASRIQRSVLPDQNLLSSIVNDYFILWEPRDVVGGDIYWVGTWGDGHLVLLGDCTGHGVPGAFVTLISIGALEGAMKEIGEGNVGQLVQLMHQYIQKTLNQHSEGGDSDDGIELGACYFVPGKSQMTFVGAKFDLYISEDGEISVVKGIKKGLGYRGISYAQEYEEKIVELKSGQIFYLTTDGLVDQVGGERRRMFGKKRFKNLLLGIHDRPMPEQQKIIFDTLIEYQGDEVRRDDVSLIGFKV